MPLPHFVVKVLSAGLMVVGIGGVCAQSYPNKPLRMITSGAGSGVDFAARLVASGLSASLGQQVIVDNKPSGFIPQETVANAAADGYTLLFYGSTVWIAPLLQSAPYDPLRDFSAITKVANSPLVLAVHPSLPVKSVGDLIALAKAKPGELTTATLGTGTPSHLGVELFKTMAGINILRVPYKSGTTQMADLMGGQVQLTLATAASVAPHVRTGRLRALAVTSAQPSALVPGLPTVAASGLPGYESGAIYVMFTPAKTPAAVISRLNRDTVRLLSLADIKEKFLSSGVEVVGSSPEELTATMKSEMARLGKVIKDAGIRAE